MTAPDLDALAREIAERWTDTDDDVEHAALHVLARHLPAPRAVVALTAEDVRDAMRQDGIMLAFSYANVTEMLNARLRARAGAPQPQWITKPESTVAAWPSVPHPTEPYMGRREGSWHTASGYGCDEVDAWRSIDRETGEVGPVVERTPSVPGVWTAALCEQFVGKRFVTMDDRDYVEFPYYLGNAEGIASVFNDTRIVAVHILPERQEVGA